LIICCYQGDPGFLGEPGDMGGRGKLVHMKLKIIINKINNNKDNNNNHMQPHATTET
jgi:hypothetical protein